MIRFIMSSGKERAADLYGAVISAVLNFYPETEAIYVFGSYPAGGADAGSDLDLAILLPTDTAKRNRDIAFSDCRFALEDALSRNVDVINLRMVNTVFQCEIIGYGCLIYLKDQYVVDEFEMNVISAYQKLNEERADILKDILQTGSIVG